MYIASTWEAPVAALLSDLTVTVRVSREFSAPAERLFEACLDAVVDEGGRLRTHPFASICHRDGRGTTYTAELLEVERPNRLVFVLTARDRSHETGRVEDCITLELVDFAAGSLLVVFHEMGLHRIHERPRVQADWIARLDQLAALSNSEGRV
jgi:uncharacterized protein YndB with AHSA1/START domain